MKKKSLIATVATVACIAAIGVGSTFAYFTDTKDVTNTFTMGNVNITLEEPNYTDRQTVLPGQVIVKDPTVALATGSNDAYVVVKVTVPQYTDGTASGDLFTYDVNTGWTEVTVENPVAGVKYYGILLEGQNRSATLFDDVTVANVTEKYKVDGDTNVDVEAYAIQAEGFDDVTAAFAAYNAQNN